LLRCWQTNPVLTCRPQGMGTSSKDSRLQYRQHWKMGNRIRLS